MKKNKSYSLIAGVLIGMVAQCVADESSQKDAGISDAIADPTPTNLVCNEYYHEWNYEVDRQTCLEYKEVFFRYSCDTVIEDYFFDNHYCWVEKIDGISSDASPMIFPTVLRSTETRESMGYVVMNNDLVLFVALSFFNSTTGSLCSYPLTGNVRYCK